MMMSGHKSDTNSHAQKTNLFPYLLKCPIFSMQNLEINTESCYQRDARMRAEHGRI